MKERFDDFNFYTPDLPCITVLNERRVEKARKDHTCHICGNLIPKGSRYDYFFVRDDDAIPPRSFASHQHVYGCPGDFL